MFWPSRKTRPVTGGCSPVITLNNVVLPAPFGPIRPVTRPLSASRSTSSRALTPPKRTPTLSTRNTDNVAHLPSLDQSLGSAAPAHQPRLLRAEHPAAH